MKINYVTISISEYDYLRDFKKNTEEALKQRKIIRVCRGLRFDRYCNYYYYTKSKAMDELKNIIESLGREIERLEKEREELKVENKKLKELGKENLKEKNPWWSFKNLI
jgi:hypothetical protein